MVGLICTLITNYFFNDDHVVVVIVAGIRSGPF